MDDLKEEMRRNVKNEATWLRFAFMVIFGIIYSFAGSLVFFIVFFQSLLTLLTGSCNQRLLPFTSRLARYVYQVLLYLTYNTDEKPFPFSDWPSDD